jgi:hypothetical protein
VAKNGDVTTERNNLDQRLDALGPLISRSSRQLIADLAAAAPVMGEIESRWWINKTIAGDLSGCCLAVLWTRNHTNSTWAPWPCPDALAAEWPANAGRA